MPTIPIKSRHLDHEIPEMPPVPFEPYVCISIETMNRLQVWHCGSRMKGFRCCGDAAAVCAGLPKYWVGTCLPDFDGIT